MNTTAQIEAEVLDLLSDQSPRHVMDIADSVQIHPITIDRTCSRLHDEGCINPLGQGLYEITEEGKDRLKLRCDP